MYALVKDDRVVTFPYGIRELQQDNPNTSFPTPVTNEVYASCGVLPVVPTDPPDYDLATQDISFYPSYDGTQWVQTWVTLPASPQEVAARTEAKATDVRAKRDSLLTASDWTQLSDSPVDRLAWSFYRDLLRDIPNQEGFPWRIVWPDTP
jgi:hypothetical protein